MEKISKVLIANRGEIALRIIRACKELDIKSVCVFSEVDIDGIWVKKADESYPIMGNPIEAYLDYERIVSLAKKANCDAVHPGYGFLSENADFARACEREGIIFIGPSADHIALFGDKIASKNAMMEVGVPVLPGTEDPLSSPQEGEEFARTIGYPVIIKAAFGGGGRGMRIVYEEKDFVKAFEEAQNESIKYFARDEVFVERYLQNPRHIEIQILADSHGNVIHVGDRDCSIQRRNQKVIEIAPAPNLRDDTRRELYRVATKAMYKLGYKSAGTVEFLVDKDENIYFMEMNTRIQVEHPVTELISGLDLIQRMIKIADGAKLEFLQEEVSFRGYAIEFRINAENTEKDFAPHPGTITEYMSPGGPGVRLDTIAYKGYTIPAFYDSMIGKLIVYSTSWDCAVKKAERALSEYVIEGIPTNIILHKQIVKDEDFLNANFNTGYFDKKLSTFNLEAKNDLEEEEEKHRKLAELIKFIKNNKVQVRH
ncbi:Biotin carboxylase of acetyl-CoA carboxylase [hydrothermal vent metagenome]|uniref:Biotin carboxylase of acetyl-CoA carboxylase n=1 Tax=hydrothermal vent metagenome TaxID=652676 RepID=A0A1W1EFC2_9ZZZZ